MIHGIISILIILIIFIIYGECRKWFIQQKLRNFKSPKQIPILGAGGRFLGTSDNESVKVFSEMFDELKETTFQIWLGPILSILTSNPQDIQTVLTSDDCLDRPFFYKFFHVNSSLLSADKELWKPHRRALNAAFNPKVLQSFVPVLNEKLRILVKIIEPQIFEQGDVHRTIFTGMADTVYRTLLGTEMYLQSERGERIYKILRSTIIGIQYRIPRCWFYSDWIYKFSKIGREEKCCANEGEKDVVEIYERKIDELHYLKLQGINYLDKVKDENAANLIERCLILEQDGLFTRKNAIDQLRTFIFASVDTSSFTVFSALLMLAINQNHQQRVVEELQSIFDSTNCDITQVHLASMEYLERVIKETWRLFPPIPFITRKVTKEIELSKGAVPKGAFIFINIVHLHRNPKIWGENPTKFDPDRFLPENVAKRPSFSYIPFSGGARNCIGSRYAMLSVKITLVHLLRQYKFTSDLKFEDIQLKANITSEIVNKNAFQFEKRQF